MYFVYFIVGALLLGVQALGAMVTADPGQDLYPEVKKVSDSLYVAQMPGQDLRLVMERVDGNNLGSWAQYVRVQSNPRVIEWAGAVVDEEGKPKQLGSLGDGSRHFRLVLEGCSCRRNEIWVAYVTTEANPQGIPQEVRNYRVSEISNRGDPFAAGIKMFVTVTSTPDALLTSHMGIAASAESLFGNRPKGISMDLHSFAAKVMRMRNPQRRFMVNAPVWAMEKIMLAGLPQGSVFIGTREMQKSLEAAQELKFEDFIKSQKAMSIIVQEMQTPTATDLATQKEWQEDLEGIRNEYRENVQRRQRYLNAFSRDCKGRGYKVVDGQVVICPESLQKMIEKRLEEVLAQLQNQGLTSEVPKNLLPFRAIDQRVQKELQEELEWRKNNYKRNPKLLQREIDDFSKECEEKGWKVANGQVVICAESLQKRIEKALEKAFEGIQNPGLVRHIPGGLLSFMKDHPPLLSADRERFFEKTLKIYEPESPSQVWLTVDEHNQDTYGWLFTVPFQPSGNTHYIAVDLVRLADAKQVAPLE